MATSKTSDAPDEVQVEAASGETVAVPEAGKDRKVTTTVWCAGKNVNREELFRQAIVNVRDAVPVASYDVSCEVAGTKAAERDKTPGTAWEISVTFTPRGNVEKPEPVDLDKIVKEAQASYGSTHPGDPNFLAE